MTSVGAIISFQEKLSDPFAPQEPHLVSTFLIEMDLNFQPVSRLSRFARSVIFSLAFCLYHSIIFARPKSDFGLPLKSDFSRPSSKNFSGKYKLSASLIFSRDSIFNL